MFDWAVGTANRLIFETKEEAAQRQEAIQIIKKGMGWTKVGVVTGLAITILGLGCLGTSGVGGLLLIGFGAVVLTLSHDLFVMAENIVELDGDAAKRGKGIQNPEFYVDQVFKKTWITNDLFGNLLKTEMRKTNP